MTKTSLSAVLAAALTISAPYASPAKEHKPKAPLAEQMETISKNLKALSKQAGDDSQRASSLQLLENIENAAKKARTLTPAKTETIPEADRAQFVADFRKKLDELLAQFDKIGGALRDGKPAEAETLIAGLKPIKRAGHEKFTVKEDK